MLFVYYECSCPIREETYSEFVPVKDVKVLTKVMFCKPILCFKINACFLKTI